ncbi:hypothetical protein D3C81_1321160 [compost metagenome]
MDVHSAEVLERAGFTGKQRQFDIDPNAGRVQPLGHQPVTPVHLLDRQPLGGDVQRHPLARFGHQRCLVLRMQAAHPHRFACLAQQQGIARTDLAGQCRAGDHHAGTGYGKGAVDGQTKTAAHAALPHAPLSLQQRLA